jgi:N-glycosylase/DNA lyase
MQLWQINEAIAGLCQDLEEEVTTRTWSQMSEQELVHELLLCILGSGVRYEIAVAYSMEITSSKCLSKNNITNPENIERKISSILNKPVDNYWGGKPYSRYRYPNTRASYISSSYCNIINNFGSFKKFLSSGYSSSELRRRIVKTCPGIGPKQASHFLKNVGYSDDLAILDRHIVKYMEIANITSVSTYQLGKLDKYEDVELQYINAVKSFKYPVAIVDQAMWFIMRALSTEQTA